MVKKTINYPSEKEFNVNHPDTPTEKIKEDEKTLTPKQQALKSFNMDTYLDVLTKDIEEAWYLRDKISPEGLIYLKYALQKQIASPLSDLERMKVLLPSLCLKVDSVLGKKEADLVAELISTDLYLTAKHFRENGISIQDPDSQEIDQLTTKRSELLSELATFNIPDEELADKNIKELELLLATKNLEK